MPANLEGVARRGRKAHRRRPLGPAAGRRFFLSIGVDRPGGLFRDLPAVPQDQARMNRTFDELGYLAGPRLRNPSAADLRAVIQSWLARAQLTRRDAMVIYFSGHGLVRAGDHYLVTHGFDADDAGTTGFPSHGLLDLVLKRARRPAKVWLILDCCQSGSALTEGLRRGLLDEETGAFLLAASGSWGEAIDGAFSTAFRRVLRQAIASAARRKVCAPSLDQLAHALNLRGLGSRVIQAGVSSSRFDLLDLERRH